MTPCKRPPAAPTVIPAVVRNLIIVYGLTVPSAIVVNAIVRAAPIGPWVGPQIEEFSWQDNVAWQLFALWWIILMAVSDFWPFNRVQPGMARGLTVIATGWAFGWITAKAVFWTGLGAGWLFPIVGTIDFSSRSSRFTGENWIVAGMALHRKLGLLLVLIAGLTYVINSSAIRWTPAWWFPFVQLGLSTALFPFLTRGMKQPGKSLAQMCILALVVLACTSLSSLLGIWSFITSPVSPFWSSGTYSADNLWLLFFMAGCSINCGLPVTMAMARMVGSVFSSMNEALCFAYMGVNRTIGLILVFGLGSERPYLWAGQRAGGSWGQHRASRAGSFDFLNRNPLGKVCAMRFALCQCRTASRWPTGSASLSIRLGPCLQKLHV